ncbi:glycosyltransferase family 4 protein [Undibacterium sp. CY18W]|uniref:Glycosyltransferase family 4 protein n=1 Tax=Undibacterium hunanense TaxID=2762292 RepID=A0ABR6ZXK0_9BURK|nr:glycosyltransferase family 4 protein [Undibacterium hunanense]MBC3920601.1 glycosyltransferase family 4 protein [Undibacterium hunanense]
MTKKTAVFTIVSLNYGAFAKTLMESLSSVHPEWDRHVLLVDRCEDVKNFGGELFSSLTIEQLPLPKMNEFLFRYGIMELNTAAKPWMFAHLRQQGYERVVYIDPDILVIDRLVDVESLLDQGAAAVVTPHLTAALDDGLMPGELEIMRAGAYNLGFLAIGDKPESDAFIKWWQEKLEYGAVSDPARGLFTDQKWVDLAPGMFGGFAILRDTGYNVAYWNLNHRPVTRENGAWFAAGRPLRFFHFSGFNPLNPKPFSKHQNRYTMANIGEASELALEYAALVLKHGHTEYRQHPYAFGVFKDGVGIPAEIRAMYRDVEELRTRAGANPFHDSGIFVASMMGGLPVILRALWMQHSHLQHAFPDPLASSREAYYRWFTESGAVEVGIPDEYVQAVKWALKELVETGDFNAYSTDIVGKDVSIWARGLIYAHKRATGGALGAARLMQYQSVRGPGDFLKIGYRQFRQSRLAGRMGLKKSDDAQRFDPLRSRVAHVPRLTQNPSRRHRLIEQHSGVFIESGGDYLWMGAKAKFSVPEFSSAILRIRGHHMGELHQRAHGQSQLKLSVSLNDGKSYPLLVQSGEFDVSLTLDEIPQQWPATLHIVAEHSFVPAELGISDDTRHLSLQLASIDIGELNVFNAKDPHTKPAKPNLPPGVNVIGYARSEHGVGQSLRQFTLAADAAGIDAAIIDFNKNNFSRVQDSSVEKRLVDEPVHRINVFHINADQMPEARASLPSHFFSRYNIGYWHWELPDMQEEHFGGFGELDEIWVPTGFVQQAIAKSSAIPVVRIPHAVSFEVSEAASRASFGLPEGKFIFLMMYDFSSYQARKNPQAALQAFELACSQYGMNAILVIKTQNAHHHEADADALRKRIAAREDIIWINKTLSRQEVYDLQSVCDALISLHRSEGFGLGPAEAMFLGKPVVATNWSGNTEFMRADNSCLVNYKLVTIQEDIGVYRAGQKWAEADCADASEKMALLVSDEKYRSRISQAARQTMQEEFSPAVIGQRISERLEFIQRAVIDN